MSETTMPIHTFMRVGQRLPADTSVLLRADHGVGKSQVVRQLASIIAKLESLNDYEVIDRRLSQMTEGDMVGLPSTDGNVTRFNPPDWYKRACTVPVCLFLDELNRATPEVMQAAFQIVLDRELNGHRLHPQTRVYAAINSGASYNVNEVDPALLDRFWCIDLRPDVRDFLNWARAKNDLKPFGQNALPLVVDFIQANERWLDPAKNADPGTVQVSRRSWERLSDALAHAGLGEEPTHNDFYPICQGYIGTEATIAFVEFAKSVDMRVTGQEILNSFKKAEPKLKRMGAERLTGAIDKVAEFALKKGKLTDKQVDNLEKFTEMLPKELRITLWSSLVKDGVDKIELAKAVHKAMAKLVLDVFEVPMGEAGVGVVPNIPGILQEKK